MIKPDDILRDFNVSWQQRLKAAQLKNDFDEFGRNSNNGLADLVGYIQFYFPNNMLRVIYQKYYCYFFTGCSPDRFWIDNPRCIDLSVEDGYLIIKKSEMHIHVLTEKIKHLCGLDSEEKFIEYLKNFNNWNSDDWLLYIAEKRDKNLS